MLVLCRSCSRWKQPPIYYQKIIKASRKWITGRRSQFFFTAFSLILPLAPLTSSLDFSAIISGNPLLAIAFNTQTTTTHHHFPSSRVSLLATVASSSSSSSSSSRVDYWYQTSWVEGAVIEDGGELSIRSKVRRMILDSHANQSIFPCLFSPHLCLFLVPCSPLPPSPPDGAVVIDWQLLHLLSQPITSKAPGVVTIYHASILFISCPSS